MTCTELDYALSPGYNTTDFTVIEGLEPFDGSALFERVRSWATYDPGVFTIRGDGTLSIEGFPSAQWLIGWADKYQLRYLQDTFCGGSYSGPVTIRTTTDIPDTLVTCNAIMTIRKLPQQNPFYGQYIPLTIDFTRIVPIETPLTLVESGVGLQFVNGDTFNLVNVA